LWFQPFLGLRKSDHHTAHYLTASDGRRGAGAHGLKSLKAPKLAPHMAANLINRLGLESRKPSPGANTVVITGTSAAAIIILVVGRSVWLSVSMYCGGPKFLP